MSLFSLPSSFRQSLHFSLKWNGYSITSGCKLGTRSRFLHDDGRNRLSNFWTPTSGVPKNGPVGRGDSHSLLLQGGFIRQAYSGLYHFLPLGLRVQEKLERLLDKHMARLGASKVSLSTFSSEDLWKKSGRLDGGARAELFQFKDRHGSRYLLSPTHEEEITTLVGSIVNSYKELPLRLYQISRKYRDETRPRQGLLRTREFLMKDLYTFDHSHEEALQTYNSVRKGYAGFFDEFKIPYMVAEADSGSIGGNLSHEYHFPTSKGEDNVISCNKCDYVANEELARSRRVITDESKVEAGHHRSRKYIYQRRISMVSTNLFQIPDHLRSSIQSWHGISENNKTLFQAILPIAKDVDDEGHTREARVNLQAIKSMFPEVNLRVESQDISFGNVEQIVRFLDYRISKSVANAYNAHFDSKPINPFELKSEEAIPDLDLLRVSSGDRCPVCTMGTLQVQTAIELGHTFFLGTRYSEPLQVSVASSCEASYSDKTRDRQQKEELLPNSSLATIQMGCHGIGVSRIIAAVADSLADEKGLNWPRVMAPFEAVVIPGKGFEKDAVDVLDRLGKGEENTVSQRKSCSDTLTVDAILDDRDKDTAWKLKDADLIGYPVIVIIGKAWKREKTCEVQCRRQSLKVEVPVEKLNEFVLRLLASL